MEKTKKIKIILGLFYLVVVSSFLYFFLSKFTLEELTSYEFIKNNKEYFNDLKKSNLFLLSLTTLVLTIFWILMAGFASPIALLSGFIFGKWLGTLIVVLGMSIGASLIYISGNYFFKDIIKNKFLNKFKSLEIKFKKSEFIYLLAYRFIGGIPFVISNLLPCIFNVKVRNFFWATLFGIMPQIFLIVSIGSGLEKVIEENEETPKIKDLIFSPEIYGPLIGFFLLIILTFILKKFFYKN
tara:strand:+ start:718 stop:1437 length:720 start_codon:yes stop_codon:yes gene_type:complete